MAELVLSAQRARERGQSILRVAEPVPRGLTLAPHPPQHRWIQRANTVSGSRQIAISRSNCREYRKRRPSARTKFEILHAAPNSQEIYGERSKLFHRMIIERHTNAGGDVRRQRKHSSLFLDFTRFEAYHLCISQRHRVSREWRAQSESRSFNGGAEAALSGTTMFLWEAPASVFLPTESGSQFANPGSTWFNGQHLATILTITLGLPLAALCNVGLYGNAQY